MRIVLRHTFDFGIARERVGPDLLRPEAWDAARAAVPAFHLPDSREEWERLADRPQLRARAADIVRLAGDLGATSLCSHGVGTGLLELNVKRLAPGLDLVCTDFAPRSAQQLALVFPEARVVTSDLRVGELPVADLHLMHRLDAELSDEEWPAVFHRLHAPVIFVPNMLLDTRAVSRELLRRLRRRRLTDAGWLRNEDALRHLWRDTHSSERIAIGDAPAFLLEPRQRSTEQTYSTSASVSSG